MKIFRDSRMYASVFFGLLFFWLLEVFWGTYVLVNPVLDVLAPYETTTLFFWFTIYAHDFSVTFLLATAFCFAFLRLSPITPSITIVVITIIMYQLVNMTNHAALFQMFHFYVGFFIPIVTAVFALSLASRIFSQRSIHAA